MISVIIPTRESERSLLPTLAALVPGATAGLIAEVIVADAGSRDATAEVADIAGCIFMSSDEPLSRRLGAAARTAKAAWLMFLQSGCVPEPGWIGAAEQFLEAAKADGLAPSAVFRARAKSKEFRPGLMEALAVLRASFAAPKPEQGLLIAKQFYLDLGGHPESADPEAALLRRIGRRRLALLAAGITVMGAHT
jgi:glycosyltransferase involved in cell wall biosynthesis